jgi:hypothetical protein
MNHLFTVILSMSLFRACQSFGLRKYGVQMDEKIENCSPEEDDAKAFDLSDLEIIAVTDMDVYVNGSLKIARKFESPIPF